MARTSPLLVPGRVRHSLQDALEAPEAYFIQPPRPQGGFSTATDSTGRVGSSSTD